MYIQPKNKLWNSCFLCPHLLLFLCLVSLFSDSFCILFVSFVVHLFWRVNEDECLKIAGVLRFTFYVLRLFRFSSVGHFQYFMTLSHCLVGVRGRTLPVRPDERKRDSQLAEGRWKPPSFICWELTHLFWINFLLSSVLFFDRRLSSFVFRLSSFVFRFSIDVDVIEVKFFIFLTLKGVGKTLLTSNINIKI